jgi:glycosyltransferase involved in cell wall biosynthesis
MSIKLLIVQIPCYNEETTLPAVVESIPTKIRGVQTIETMIIDDGSSDRTIQVAKELGITHIVRHKTNRGLAASFVSGIDACLKRGADIIVNTDGDNQYPQGKIPELIAPILAGTHDIVVADRQTHTIAHFSPLKKLFQRFGSYVVNLAAETSLPDAPSGFRAYSREAAMTLNVVTDFSYAMETIIHAGKKRIAITHVPVTTNAKTRESRLFKNMRQHIVKSGAAIIRSYTMYHPFRFFLLGGGLALLIGLIPYIRFVALAVLVGQPVNGHLQSLIFGTVFIMLGIMFVAIGLVADLLATNRRLIEDTLYRLKKLEYKQDTHTENRRQFLAGLSSEVEELREEFDHIAEVPPATTRTGKGKTKKTKTYSVVE